MVSILVRPFEMRKHKKSRHDVLSIRSYHRVLVDTRTGGHSRGGPHYERRHQIHLGNYWSDDVFDRSGTCHLLTKASAAVANSCETERCQLVSSAYGDMIMHGGPYR